MPGRIIDLLQEQLDSLGQAGEGLVDRAPPPQTAFTDIACRAPHTRIRALPARITNRIGRFHRTPGAAIMYHMAGSCTFTGSGTCIGLDLWVRTFAPCLLGCPGTGRQNPVLTSPRPGAGAGVGVALAGELVPEQLDGLLDGLVDQPAGARLV